MLRSLKNTIILIYLQHDYDRFAEYRRISLVPLEWIMLSDFGAIGGSRFRGGYNRLSASILRFRAPSTSFPRRGILIDAKWLSNILVPRGAREAFLGLYVTLSR